MLVLLTTPDDAMDVRRVRLRDRLLARVLADRLDESLIAGRAPDSGVLLALRAQALEHSGRREEYAIDLHEIALTAVGQRPTGRSGWPMHWECIAGARAELEALSERLLAPGPVSPRGMALVRMLLTDGSGPLYFADTPEQVARAAMAAMAALDAQPDW